MSRLIFKYQWRLLIRNPFQLAALFFTMLFSMYAIYYGYREISRQKKAIAVVELKQRQQREAVAAGFLADTTTAEGKRAYQLSAIPGYSWHRHQYAAVFKPAALAPLAIGQRDLQPYYYTLSGMSLYYQIFQNEIANPQKLLVGNFDLSFVFIYLFPLLIISFCYNLLSSEKSYGLIALLRSQAYPIHRVILWRLAFYSLMILGIALLLSIAGFLACDVSATDWPVMVLWLCTLSLYLMLWFALLLLIISFNYNSAFNAILGIGCWLFLLVLIPALVNVFVTIKMPLNSNILTGISRRTGVIDEEIEENHIVVIKEFVARYPAYDNNEKKYKKNLFAKGFAAFTALKDDNSSKLVANYQQQVNKREQLAGRFGLLNPAVRTQNLFDALGGSDLNAFQNFYRSVVHFHRQIVRFYYPKLFKDQAFELRAYDHAPKFELKQNALPGATIFNVLFQLFITFLVLAISGYVILTRKLTKPS